MLEWFQTLSSFEKILWYISTPFTLIFIIQLVLSIAGLDGRKLNKNKNESDMVEVSGDEQQVNAPDNVMVSFGLSFFSMRNIIVFLMVFGWVGINVYHHGFSKPITLLISVVAGGIMMIIFSLMFYFSHKK